MRKARIRQVASQMKRALRVTWLRVNTAPFEIPASPVSRMYPESWNRAVTVPTARARRRARAVRVAPLVTGHEPRHREHDVLRMLQVVVDGIDAEVAGRLPGEEPLEIRERGLERLARRAGPGVGIELQDRLAHGRRGADLHRVGDVEIAAAIRPWHGAARPLG